MKGYRRIRWSIILPVIMLIYLIAMSCLGLDHYRAGNYLRYFGVIGIGLAIIIYMYCRLHKREKMRDMQQEEEAEYGTYEEAKEKRDTKRP